MKILLKHIAFLFILMLVNIYFILAQGNGLVRFDATKGKTEFINEVGIDSSKTFNSTDYNTGELSDIAELNLRKSLNHINGSGFTDIYTASSWFNTETYPARTSVKLFYYRNGALHELCSGTIISDNLVVTSAHCIYYYFDESDSERNWLDSILVIPGYDNATINSSIGRVVSTKYYVFQNWYNEIDLNYDMALIELNKPIGNKTGWVGIGYNAQNQFFTNNVFHNFSYPSAAHPFDSSRVYDGNTLYYSYGMLDTVAKYEIGHKVNAIPGQSGSSVIFSDNRKYQVYGVLSNHLYGYGTLFNRITASKFYALKNIIEHEAAFVNTDNSDLKENENTIQTIDISKNYNLTRPKNISLNAPKEDIDGVDGQKKTNHQARKKKATKK